MPSSLKKAYEQVRSDYFPRWDRKGRWHCRQMAIRQQRRGDGLCVPSTHTIYIAWKGKDWSREQKLGVIIHEICHAMQVRSGHETAWQRRLARTAEKAESTGDVALARWLRQEVLRYQPSPRSLTPKSVYGEIQDYVKETGTVPSFAVMVAEFSRSRAMTLREFLKRYARTKQVYQAAVSANHRPSRRKSVLIGPPLLSRVQQ
jgi:hypothetical protein